MRALFRLKGFSLPEMESYTSIQNTFVTQMQNLARPGSVLGYSAHRWVKRLHKPLWRTFAVAALSMGVGLGLIGLSALGAPVSQTIVHAGAWLFVLSILPLFGVAMAVGYSFNVMPEQITQTTRNRFLKLGAEVAHKDRMARPLLKQFGEQLDKGFPNQWWESACLVLEEYNNALNTRILGEQKQKDNETLHQVFMEAVGPIDPSTPKTQHITL